MAANQTSLGKEGGRPRVVDKYMELIAGKGDATVSGPLQSDCDANRVSFSKTALSGLSRSREEIYGNAGSLFLRGASFDGMTESFDLQGGLDPKLV
jgi:hypothetical protein